MLWVQCRISKVSELTPSEYPRPAFPPHFDRRIHVKRAFRRGSTAAFPNMRDRFNSRPCPKSLFHIALNGPCSRRIGTITLITCCLLSSRRRINAYHSSLFPFGAGRGSVRLKGKFSSSECIATRSQYCDSLASGAAHFFAEFPLALLGDVEENCGRY